MSAGLKRAEAPAVQLFLNRLTLRSVLTEAEQEAILTLPFEVATYRANHDFVRQAQLTDHACLIAEGLVGRFGQTAAGKRQIIAFHIPGDMADLHSVVAPHAVSALQALTNVSILRSPHAALRDVASKFPAIGHAFWRDGIVDSGLIAQGMVNLGVRDAGGRMAHMFCEMGIRYEQIGQGTKLEYPFPATQNHIGDALGLTPIHVNRTLRALREDGVVTMAARMVTVHDWDRLKRRAEFDSNYLQLEPVDFHRHGAETAARAPIEARRTYG